MNPKIVCGASKIRLFTSSSISIERFLIPSVPISSPKIPQLGFGLTNTALVFSFNTEESRKKIVGANCKAKQYRHFFYNPPSLYHFQFLNEVSTNKIKLVDKRKK